MKERLESLDLALRPLWPKSPKRLGRLVVLLGTAAVLPSLISNLWFGPILQLLLAWLGSVADEKHLEALLEKRIERTIERIILNSKQVEAFLKKRIEQIVLEILRELKILR